MTSRGSRTIVGALLLAVVVVGWSACGSGDGGRQAGPDGAVLEAPRAHEVKVLTRNLYLGADLAPLFEATPADLGARIRATYDQVVASDVEGRLDAVARELVDNRPDVVALQEASLWRVQPPGATAPDVLYDFVQILLTDLERRGETYTVAASVDGFSGGLPVEDVGFVTLLDRDVILVRDGSGVDVTDTASGNFAARLSLNVAGVPIEIVRGWASVDAKVGGRAFRLIGTHLEAFGDPVRDQQQEELIALAKASPLPTLLLGDLNSAARGADSKAYDDTLRAGFSDAWTEVPAAGASATCCRTADLTGGSYDERIDFVLFRGPFDAVGAEVIGNDRTSRTAEGLWSSDHGGVVAVLEVGT